MKRRLTHGGRKNSVKHMQAELPMNTQLDADNALEKKLLHIYKTDGGLPAFFRRIGNKRRSAPEAQADCVDTRFYTLLASSGFGKNRQ